MFNISSIITKAFDKINSTEFLNKNRKKSSYFSRGTAKMTFPRLITYLLTTTKSSTQIVLNKFFGQLDGDINISKQAFFETREKLSHNAFIELNSDAIGQIYSNYDYNKALEMRIVAIDGSVFDLPSSAMSKFGALKTIGNPIAKAQALAFVDVLNDVILYADLKPYGTGETNMCYDKILDYSSLSNDLLIFDRGFFSRKLTYKLASNNRKFLFLVSTSVLKEINNANKSDQLIEIDNADSPLKLRVINVVLPNGTKEKLVTNLLDKDLSCDDFKTLYNLRWGIEVNFLILKQRLQIENFSSGKKELILQDFFASVYLSNLVSVACNEVSENIAKISHKYSYKPNKNIAIAEIRILLFKVLLSKCHLITDFLFECTKQKIKKFLIPIRPNRLSLRNIKNKSARFPLNKKGNL